MDTNSFRPEMAAALDPETRKLTEERDVLGPVSYTHLRAHET